VELALFGSVDSEAGTSGRRPEAGGLIIAMTLPEVAVILKSIPRPMGKPAILSQDVDLRRVKVQVCGVNGLF
jgi:hypothetical protein